ncbi:MAG: hypothetical protein ACRDZ5_00575 [Acidimicrobiales bacterium]
MATKEELSSSTEAGYGLPRSVVHRARGLWAPPARGCLTNPLRRIRPNHALMGTYSRKGTVGAGTTDWAQVLAGRDPVVETGRR